MLVTCSPGRPDPTPPRPNVLLISIDSLRADHVHCYGHPFATSPNLDRLAAQGALFEQAIAESPWTLPSHATLLTGLSQAVHRAGCGGQRIPDGATTLAETLSAHGYRTFGVWSGPFLHPFFGFAQGFAPADYQSAIGATEYDSRSLSTDSEADRERMTDIHAQAHAGTTSPQVAERAIRFLQEPHDQPFFLFLHFFDVHYDYVPPEPYWRMFDPDYHGVLDPADYAHSAIDRTLSDRDLRHLLARYDGEIRFTDEAIGRVLTTLDTLELAADTIVVVTADHGEEFFEHGNKGHQSGLHDEVLRVPLILRYPPRVGAGVRVKEQVRHLDVMPTLLELAGIPWTADPPLMGASLARVARDGRDGLDPPAVARLWLGADTIFTALRTRRDKLVRWSRAGTESASAWLDLVADAAELQPQNGPVVHDRLAAMTAQLERIEQLERAMARQLEDPTGADAALPAEIRRALQEMGYTR